MKGFLIFCDVYLAFLESPVSVHSQRELFLVSENLKKVFTIESFAVSQERDDFFFLLTLRESGEGTTLHNSYNTSENRN